MSLSQPVSESSPPLAGIAPESPRGVSPEILLSQVRNTAPFIFEDKMRAEADPSLHHLRTLQELATQKSSVELNHVEYFRLCLSAHHATVATFVPTDVDNQIRFRLWHPTLPVATLVEMAQIVLESHDWDSCRVSTRWVRSPRSGIILSGHHGEWFSTAAGAYGSLRKREPATAQRLMDAILAEMNCHAQVFEDFREVRDGIGLLKTATLIAHNLGDLDRVMDQWNLPQNDPLRLAAFKAGHEDLGRFGGVLQRAGGLNKAYMADENHRHFALREAKPLRKSADLLLPMGPFFDDWGKTVARHTELTPEQVGLVTECLVNGWERQQKVAAGGNPPVGYARSLAGILDAFPGGFAKLGRYIPARVERSLKAGPLRALCAISKTRFEEQWAKSALTWIKEHKGA